MGEFDRNPHVRVGNDFGPARLQYHDYSIFINGDTRGLDILRGQLPDLTPGNHIMPQIYWKLEHQEARRYMYAPPADESRLVQFYEHRVRELLDEIWHSIIGNCLLDSLNDDYAVWIRPWKQDSSGYCNAITRLESSNIGATGIEFSPEIWTADGCGHGLPGSRPVEVLFHELVHASRFSNNSYENLDHASLEQMTNGEEFLAVMITNSFTSERGGTNFARDYNTSTTASQDELEKFLSSNRNYIERIKFFLSIEDPLVTKVVKLKMSLNIFRDFERLEKAYQNSGQPAYDHFNDQMMDKFVPGLSKVLHSE